MEITAKKTNKVSSLDKIDFEKQPRAQRVTDRTRADQRRAGRSNSGNLKDAAQTHAGRYGKLGFKSIQDRMEKDPFYLFNNTVGQIMPDCCQFLEDLAKCISPDVGRTREKREKQLGTGVSTRLVFMPDFARDIRLALDVTKEAMIAHHARLFTLPQFAVLAADLLKARGNPRRCFMDGLALSCRSINGHRRTASLTSLTSPSASGTRSTTTSRGLSTHLRKRLLHLMCLSSHWQDLRGLELGRAVRGTDETLTPSIDLAKGTDTVSRGPSFSRQLNAGSAGSMATSPLSATVAGLDNKIGVLLRDTIQAAREGRPIGDVETGDRAIRAKDGQMIGVINSIKLRCSTARASSASINGCTNA